MTMFYYLYKNSSKHMFYSSYKENAKNSDDNFLNTSFNYERGLWDKIL